jgi:hypothetical protein
MWWHESFPPRPSRVDCLIATVIGFALGLVLLLALGWWP